jgi:hypothetical protein
VDIAGGAGGWRSTVGSGIDGCDKSGKDSGGIGSIAVLVLSVTGSGVAVLNALGGGGGGVTGDFSTVGATKAGWGASIKSSSQLVSSPSSQVIGSGTTCINSCWLVGVLLVRGILRTGAFLSNMPCKNLPVRDLMTGVFSEVLSSIDIHNSLGIHTISTLSGRRFVGLKCDATKVAARINTAGFA